MFAVIVLDVAVAKHSLCPRRDPRERPGISREHSITVLQPVPSRE